MIFSDLTHLLKASRQDALEAFTKDFDKFLQGKDDKDEKIKEYASLIREEYHKSLKKSNRQYGIFFSCTILYTLIETAGIQKVTVLGIEFSQEGSALLLIPIVGAFYFYRSVISKLINSFRGFAYHHFLDRYYGDFKNHTLRNIILEDDFVSQEELLMQLLRNNFSAKLTAVISALLVAILLLFPMIWFGWVSREFYYSHLSDQEPVIRLLLLLPVTLLPFRAIILAFRMRGNYLKLLLRLWKYV